MVTEAVPPIFAGQDFYVPYFEIRLANRALPGEVIHDVQQVTYKDSITDLDSAELTLNNWDADRLAYKYSDEDMFLPGERFEFYAGFRGHGDPRLMLRGEIISLRPSFPSGGSPTLGVQAVNLLHKFRRAEVSAEYRDKTDSEVADEIGARLGIPISPPASERPAEDRHEYLIQENQPDIVFLADRARRIGYDLFVQESETGDSSLYFGPSLNLTTLTTELTYGRGLIEFSTNLTTAYQVSKVTVRSWNMATKEKITYTAERSQLRTQGVGESGGQGRIDSSFSDRELVLIQPVNSLAEARTLATETLENNCKEMLTATGSTIGIPELRAGSVLMLSGLGERFSGRYFVTGTTHTIGDSGYTTQFECRREEV